VKITGPQEAKIGDTVLLTCTSTVSYPKADILWYKGGFSEEPIATALQNSQDGDQINVSNVTFVIEPTDITVVVLCQCINRKLGEFAVDTHTIRVMRKFSQLFNEGYICSGVNLCNGCVTFALLQQKLQVIQEYITPI